MPVNELENLISSCVKSALRYPPVQQSKERLLTEQQAADFLEIPEPTLQALIQKCEIPIRTKGKRCYFSQQDLLAWKSASELYGNDLTLNHKSGGSNG